MTRVHEGLDDPGFPVPESVESASICRKSGKLAISGVCDNDPRGNAIYREYFAKGTVPTEVCNVHVTATVCEESGQLPTEFCINRVGRVFMSLPAGESGETDDSHFSMPGACTLHTAESTILPPEMETTPEVPYGPGYIPNPPSPSRSGPIAPTIPSLYDP